MKVFRVKLLGILSVILVQFCTVFADDDSTTKDVEQVYSPPKFVKPTLVNSQYFFDWFSDRSAIGKKWLKSVGKKNDVEDSIAKYNGEWEIGEPRKKVIEEDYALIVKSKARHHAIAAKFDRPFKFDGKPLVAQYEVKYEEGQDCGGGYIKLLTIGEEKKLHEFTDKTPYTVMFGPDKCGQTSRVHLIIRLKNPKNNAVTEHHAKQPSKSLSMYFDDHHTHLYTLVIRPDDSFSVMVDQSQLISGNLLTDLDPPITPPIKIDDPDDKKPDDWDEREKIDDPDAKKPDDWDDNAPKEIDDTLAVKPQNWLEDVEPMIPDPDAVMPEDWDESMDGEWEAPLVENPACKGVSGCGKWTAPRIPNPAYKGKWKPPRIANPAYKGKWAPKQIENPAYFLPQPYSQLQPIASIGIELWTMSANIIFDNIYIGDDEKAALAFASQTFSIKKNQEAVYDSAIAPSRNIFGQLISATEERPWLWAVYVLSLLIPILIIALIFFRRKGKSAQHYKKTDESIPEDETLLNEDEKSNESGDESESFSQNSHLDSSNLRRSESDDSIAAEAKNSDDDGAFNHKSPKGKRIRQRKQD